MDSIKRYCNKHDIVLIASIIIISVIMLVGFNLFVSNKSTVNVYLNGTIIRTYNLTDEVDEVITNDSGNYNHLIIHNNRVYLSDADCPDRLCVNQKPLDDKGGVICCVPNNLLVKVCGGKEDEYDAYTD